METRRPTYRHHLLLVKLSGRLFFEKIGCSMLSRKLTLDKNTVARFPPRLRGWLGTEAHISEVSPGT